MLGFDLTKLEAAIVLIISAALWWYSPSRSDTEEAIKLPSSEPEVNMGFNYRGLGRAVRGKVLYSSKKKQEEEDEEKRLRDEEEAARKKAEDEDFEAFKKKKWTMKDIPDFTFKIDDGDAGLSSFI